MYIYTEKNLFQNVFKKSNFLAILKKKYVIEEKKLIIFVRLMSLATQTKVQKFLNF